MQQAADKAKAAQQQAENAGDFAGAAKQAAAAKAAQAAADAAKTAATMADTTKTDANGKKLYPLNVLFIEYLPNGTKYYSNTVTWAYAPYGSNNNLSRNIGDPTTYKLPVPSIDGGVSYTLKDKNSRTVSYSWSSSYTPDPTKTQQDMTLTETEIVALLKRMLESQQTNHKELMNQLSQMGSVVSNATTGQQYTAATAVSEPYTVAGSNTPQQTVFSVDEKGNVTATVIQRPNLAAHSSQAPTRTAITSNTTSPTTSTTSPTDSTTTSPTTSTTSPSQQEPADICKLHPNSAACAQLGNTDYEDLSIPKEPINLSFNPVAIFATDGTCPAPVSFSFGALGQFQIEYDFLCKVARMVRPILVLGTIISCAFFVHSAVKEL